MDNQILLDELLCVAKQKYPLVQGKLIQPQQLIFQEWVKMSCFYCGKYNSNWKCPPRLPEKIDFEKMVREFPVGAFIFLGHLFLKRTMEKFVIHRRCIYTKQF